MRRRKKILIRREKVSDLYDTKVFSNNFRKYFLKSGMTKRKFLSLVGTKKSSFYNWYNGHCVPLMKNIEGICRAFNISIKDLMGEEIK